MNYTEDQRRVIDTRDNNILVSAAAGSGKTAVLVARIMSRLLDPREPADIDRLLIVTFTRAAAGEMRERIMKAIAAERERQPENEHLARQAALIHNAQITTIDGFCSYVVRCYGHTIGLAPGFRVAEQGELKLLMHDVAGQTLEEAYAVYAKEGDEEFAACVETLAPDKSDERLEEAMLRLYREAQSNPNPEKWLSLCLRDNQIGSEEELEQSEWLQTLMKEACDRAASVISLAEQNLGLTMRIDGPGAYTASARSQLDLLRTLLEGTTYRHWYEVVKAYVPVRLPGGRGKKTENPSLRELFKQNRELISSEIDYFRSAFVTSPEEALEDIRLSSGPLATLVRLTLRFGELYAEEKQKRNIMEFSDLEHAALKILRGDHGRTDTARELASLYTEVMIDEYQDSNFLQEAILTAVSRMEDGERNYFCVGDVKQSIYSFRQARPDLFMGKYYSYPRKPEEGVRIDLHKNFRSRREVLDTVNGLFRQLMRREVGGIDYDEDAALVAGLENEDVALTPDEIGEKTQETAAFHEKIDFNTELLTVLTDSEEELEDDGPSPTKVMIEARAVGMRIRQLVERGLIRDDRTKQYRKISFRDIVILMRSVTGTAEAYVKVLEELRIPAYAEVRGGYFGALEVRTVLSFLTLLDNTQNDIALAAVLRSAFVGLSAEQLAEIRTFEGVRSWTGSTVSTEVSYYDAARQYAERGGDEETVRLLRDFFAFFDRLREMLGNTALHELVYRIVTESGYLDYVSALPGGAQRALNLRMLVDRAAEYEKTSYVGLFNFIRYIENLRKQDADLDELGTASEDEDVVRIYTIHKSKGLEYPIVFLTGTARRFNRTAVNADLLIHPVMGLASDYTDLKKRLKKPTLRRLAVRQQMVRDSVGEELRVLYVALTRAKQKLIITGTADDEDDLAEKELLLPLRETVFPQGVLTGASSVFDWIYPAAVRLRKAEELTGRPCSLEILPVKVSELVTETAVGGLHREEILEEVRRLRAEQGPDPEIRAELLRRFSYVYPWAGRENIPVEMSVSELKHRVWEELEEERAEDEAVHLYPEYEDGDELDFDEAEPEEAQAVPAFEPCIPEFMKPQISGSVTEPEAPKLGGAARGTAYHQVMELLDFQRFRGLSGGELKAAVRTALAELRESGRLSEELEEVVRIRDLAVFAESALGKRYIEAHCRGSLHREQPFVTEIPASEVSEEWPSDEMVYVQGIIDAYFREEDGLVLLDYKTDRVRSAEELIDRYKIQLRTYAEALEAASGERVKELLIWSFTLGRSIRVERAL